MGYLKEGSPARYHLSTTETGLTVAIHKKVLPKASDYRKGDPDFFGSLNKIHDVFIPPTPDREWGYGEVIREEESEHPDFVLYSVDFPKHFSADGISDRVYGVAASLKLLFDAVNFKPETTAKEKQNLMVNLALDRTREVYGSVIGVDLYSNFTNALGNATTNLEEKVVSAMVNSFKLMWGDNKLDLRYSFLARIMPPKDFHLAVFGNSCGLDTDVDDRLSDTIKLIPHNTDNPVQQLSLLAGVARMEEFVTNNYFRKNPNQMDLNL